jgi:uracil-DNA glycosylase family 4
VGDPHPVTGELFDSPVPPGTGWPGDPATRRTPVARSDAEVRELALSARDVATLDARVSVCRACPRLVEWRESVARTGRRASFADQPYWGRPGPGFGDPAPRLLVVGLAPAANGTNRTGRMFTGDRSGDWIYAALHRAGYAAVPWSRHAGDGQALVGARIVAAVRCAPPANKPSPQERSTCGHWLDRDLELAAPSLRVLLALGSIGWEATLASVRRIGGLHERPKPRFGHGARAEIVVPEGLQARGAAPVWTLLGSYHVSQQNTFTGKLTEPMLDAVLATARALSEG